MSQKRMRAHQWRKVNLRRASNTNGIMAADDASPSGLSDGGEGGLAGTLGTQFPSVSRLCAHGSSSARPMVVAEVAEIAEHDDAA